MNSKWEIPESRGRWEEKGGKIHKCDHTAQRRHEKQKDLQVSAGSRSTQAASIWDPGNGQPDPAEEPGCSWDLWQARSYPT